MTTSVTPSAAAARAGRVLAFERRLRALRAEPRPLADDVCEETPAIPGYDGISLHSWGGMATIYRARDTAIGRPVAIKLLSSHAIHGKAGRHRALREARLLARLAHPGVVAIHATGIWRDRPYLVLEWIDGCTLQDRIDEGILDPPRAAAIALELAKTLVDLHGAGIIHRDLKPDNVLLAAPAADGHGETVKLIDFGLARPDDDRAESRTPGDRPAPAWGAPQRNPAAKQRAAGPRQRGSGAPLPGRSSRRPTPASRSDGGRIEHLGCDRATAFGRHTRSHPGLRRLLKYCFLRDGRIADDAPLIGVRPIVLMLGGA